jgi:hypothetical protein
MVDLLAAQRARRGLVSVLALLAGVTTLALAPASAAAPANDCSPTMNGAGTIAPGTAVAPNLRVVKSQYQLNDCPTAIFTSSRASDGSLWATDNSNGLWHSTDDMASWHRTFVASAYRQVEDVVGLSSGTLLIVVRDASNIRHVLRSTDTTGTAFAATPVLNLASGMSLQSVRNIAELGGAVYLGPFGSAGPPAPLYKSTNDGQSFAVVSTLPAVRSVRGIYADPQVSGRLWMTGSDTSANSRIAYSDDGGATFTFISQGVYGQRATGMMFTSDAVYWTSDPIDVPGTLWRWDRGSHQITAVLKNLNSAFFFAEQYQGLYAQFSLVQPQSTYAGDNYIHAVTSSGGTGWSATRTPLARFDTTTDTQVTGITTPDFQGRFWVSFWNVGAADAKRSNVEFQLDSLASFAGPLSSFTAVVSPQSVAFDGSASSSPAGPIGAYDWSFGDGAIGTGATTTHQYPSGSYSARLQVTDSIGNSNESARLVEVASGLPSVSTQAATAVDNSSATGHGGVTPGNVSASAHFEWGTDTSYGSSTANQTVAASTTVVAVTAPITGLVPLTTYHYRLVAGNTTGTAYGEDRTFTTAAAPTCSLTTNGPGTITPGTTIAPRVRVLKSQYGVGTCDTPIVIAGRAPDGTVWATDNRNDIWKSTDDAATWTETFTAYGYSQVETLVPLSSGTILALVRDSGGIRHILRSRDASGYTFATTTSLDLPTNGYLLSNRSFAEMNGTVYVGDTGHPTGGPTLWKSTDDGRTFSVVRNFPHEDEIHTLRLDPYAPGRLWVLFDPDTVDGSPDHMGVVYTDDGGQSFVNVSSGSYPQSRVVDLMFTADAVFWGTDTPEVPAELWRWDRSTHALTRMLSGVNGAYYFAVQHQGMFAQFSGVETPKQNYVGDEFIHVLGSAGGTGWSETRTPLMRTPGDANNNSTITNITMPDAQGRFWVSWWNLSGSQFRRANIEMQLDPFATMSGPLASLTAAPTWVAPNTPVNFDGSGSSSPAGGLTYKWDFGDGSSSTGATTTHPYASVGSQDAVLQVTDANGDSHMAEQPITVSTAPAPPKATTAAATLVTSSGATLNATVNGNGGATTVRFEWGSDTSYGQTTPLQDLGTTSGDQPVSAAVTGLQASTVYHYRVVATNGSGTTHGADATFTTVDAATTGPPILVTGDASAKTAVSATLNGTVDPNGLSTTSHFEYRRQGTVTWATTSDQDAGSSSANVPVSGALTGLAASITYEYRVVATNTAGTSTGATNTFVTAAGPSSQATAPASSSATAITVGYTAAGDGSALQRVDLYASGPGASGYTLAASDTSPSASGSFSYDAGGGDGSYRFYTVATDAAGAVEAVPSSPDAITLVDTIAPSSAATAPATALTTAITVSYTAADSGSGLQRVDLYAQAPGETRFTLAASDTAPQSSGSFAYVAAAGDGSYRFYTVARDAAGNSETAPANADAVTRVAANDILAPTSSATSPAVTTSQHISVTYTAADNPGGSGLARVELYVRGPGAPGYTLAASDTAATASGTFDYLAATDGAYAFYTVASDLAGNKEAAPASPDSTTLLDRLAPSSAATAPAFSGAGNVTVGYAVADTGSGPARVDLYVRPPGASTSTLVASDTSPHASGSFGYAPSAGEGAYGFYTVATDAAGNVEAAPGTPDASTTVDTTAPVSQADAPATSGSSSFTVTYTAADGAAGVARVDLYARAPGASGYTLAASDSSPAATGGFNFAASGGDGTYSFYTRAVDAVGNVEAAPAAPDAETALATSAPTSAASAPAMAGPGPITVGYTAAPSGSAVARVDLYVRTPNSSGYALAASDLTPGSSGSFSYSAADGDGSYSFYSVATDALGHVEDAPSQPDATTDVDATAPTSSASADAYSRSTTLSVSYTAADGADGSGLARVDLYVRGPGDAGYSKVASDASPQAGGSFSYAAGAEGTYGFYTVAIDQAGNAEAAPATADAATELDVQAPTSAATAPATSTSSSITIAYSASDGGSGVARVDLFAQAPGQPQYALVASDTSPQATGSFTYPTTGDGTYRFYTVAADRAGNVELPPATPDATTSVDSSAPASSAGAPTAVASHSVAVAYSATEGGAGLARVDLFAKGPGDSDYAKVASDTSPQATGSFAFDAAVDGTYRFYTVAVDTSGNTEAAPADADAVTVVDTQDPVSSASASATSTSSTFSVSYAANDGAVGSGLATVELYAKAPAAGTFTKVATDSAPGASGSFTFTATSNGAYGFYTVAKDAVGHVEAAPTGADVTVAVDTISPSSMGSAPATQTFAPIPVTWTASDAAGGSGLARVDLYVQNPGQTTYAQAMSQSTSATSGTFTYTPNAGNGTYRFYTIAVDVAGNAEAGPSTPDASTNYTLDVAPPASAATGPAYRTTTSITLNYSSSDAGGSALASVELWARSPGATAFARVSTSTTTSGSFAYSATTGDGAYAFYTIAVDGAGNREAAPSTPDVTTVVDTVAPGSFAMSDVAQYLSGTVPLSLVGAPVETGSGLASVAYSSRPAGAATWTVACTATAGPWSCNWNTATTKTPNGSYDVRAIATDRAGNTTQASNTPITGRVIDNTRPTALTVATANATGGLAGRLDTGDTLTLTYSEQMKPASILAGWNGSTTAVQVRVANKSAGDNLTVWKADGSTRIALCNPVALGGDYVPSGDVTFNATMVLNGSVVVVNLGAIASGARRTAAVTGGTVTWTPDTAATDLAGNKVTNTAVSVAGPAF